MVDVPTTPMCKAAPLEFVAGGLTEVVTEQDTLTILIEQCSSK